MKSYNKSDVKLLKSARLRVRLALMGLYLYLGVCFYAINWVLELPLFRRPDSMTIPFIISVVAQACIWLMICLLLDTEKPWSRTVYWIGVTAEAAYSLYLCAQLFLSSQNQLVYLVWGLCLLLCCYGLYLFGKWLGNSYWCKIFFEKTLMVYKNSTENLKPSISHEGMPAASRTADFESPPSHEYEQDEEESVQYITKKIPTYPQLAIRLGICIYGELIVFPIFTEVFKSIFSSTDGKYSFATTGMFTLTIITAVIWTVLVFFLYLKQPKSKMVTILCIASEVLVTIWYSTLLQKYASNPDITYKIHVFILFILLDLIREAILLYTIWPVFTLPVPSLMDNLNGQSLDEDLYEKRKLNFSSNPFRDLSLDEKRSENNDPSEDSAQNEDLDAQNGQSGFSSLQQKAADAFHSCFHKNQDS